MARPPLAREPARARLAGDYLRPDEAAAAQALAEVDAAYPPAPVLETRAAALVRAVRSRAPDLAGELLAQFGFASAQGRALMLLAEALGRIPDDATASRLVRDTLAGAPWAPARRSASWRAGAAARALALATRVETLAAAADEHAGAGLARVLGRAGEGAVRGGLRQAVARLGESFVFAGDIAGALRRAARAPRWRYSFDLLGEAALSAAEADGYLAAYREAIARLSAFSGAHRPGLSVKLSALHPRFEEAQRRRVLRELVPRLAALAARARTAGVTLTVDAEEARRLELTLDVYAAALTAEDVRGWDGFGLAVQAYQKRAPALLEALGDLARESGARLPVRLVKGAYWDGEIKRAQALGLEDYPVYTRKAATDVAYLACAARLLGAPELYFPQFATHNAHTVVALRSLAGDRPHEFQRLHGMGEALYETLREESPDLVCRVYAPVGRHDALVPYLVRRLLENGANTSFVHQLHDPRLTPEALAHDPRRALEGGHLRSRRLPRPPQIYPDRRAARGWDPEHPATRAALEAAVAQAAEASYRAAPAAGLPAGAPEPVHSPAPPARVVGRVQAAHPQAVREAAARARQAQPAWAALGVDARARCLEAIADRLEAQPGALAHLLIAEAGRTLPNALAELREAVDFCRYYAVQARTLGAPRVVDCPVGEENRYGVHARGLAACISPWNFPLSIFTGQVVAALVTGNAVLAKPAPQAPLTAAQAVGVMHACGVPTDVLQLLPGGAEVGAAIIADAAVDVVAFTGSLATARAIQDALAARPGLMPPLIAETGGINAMVVDATALPDQVVPDVLRSAFDSAGQRCSALRLVCVQEEAAPALARKLVGAVAELRVGDPADPATDVGPLIDAGARERIEAHLARLHAQARLLASAPPPASALRGHFVTPQVWEIPHPGWLDAEVFGPVLHLVRYRAAELEALTRAIAASGYGLTLGVHSRLRSTLEAVTAAVPVGNVYVNRDMIGAVVGTQPFGGSGLSGTGPKAGGPLYLTRFVHERVVSTNTAAVGGNAALYAQED